MQPITRETFIDRRQPVLRWSAVAAGAITTVGVWITLLAIGTGGSLASATAEDAQRVHHFGCSAGTWAILSPLLAMFAGGVVTGVLSHTHAARQGALHGLVMWGLAGIAGVLVAAFAIGAHVSAVRDSVDAHYDDRYDDDDVRASLTTRRVNEAGKALAAGGAALLLGLGAAAAGGALGARGRRKRNHHHDTRPMGVVVTGTPATTLPVVPHAEDLGRR